MLRQITTRVVRNSTRLKTFPKISPAKFNKLWNITHRYFMTVDWADIISIIKLIFNRYGTSALIAIPSLFLLVKNSQILDDKDSKDHPKMFKALSTNEIKFDNFILSVLSFSSILRVIKFLFKILWLPFKIAVIFYLLHKIGYDVSSLYQKINNLSLGLIDWYLKLILDFIKSLR